MTNKHFTLIHADGRTEHFEGPEDLKQLQGWVNGYIEMVPGFKTFEGQSCYAYCNEDGKAQDLPLNQMATTLWRTQLDWPSFADYLCGTVVIVH